MSFEDKFSKQIDDFQRYGTYTYKYDEAGNVIFDSSSNDFSNVYLGLPLLCTERNNAKILSFYDPTFTEFFPSVPENTTAKTIEEVQTELDNMTVQNEQLVGQLNTLIAVNESSPSVANEAASKSLILELRKKLGQGRINSDFSIEFPYAPIAKEANLDDSDSLVNE